MGKFLFSYLPRRGKPSVETDENREARGSSSAVERDAVSVDGVALKTQHTTASRERK